jgi:hypothetical protein
MLIPSSRKKGNIAHLQVFQHHDRANGSRVSVRIAVVLDTVSQIMKFPAVTRAVRMWKIRRVADDQSKPHARLRAPAMSSAASSPPVASTVPKKVLKAPTSVVKSIKTCRDVAVQVAFESKL